MKRRRNLVHITSKIPDLTFLSKILRAYETSRSFVRFDRKHVEMHLLHLLAKQCFWGFFGLHVYAMHEIYTHSGHTPICSRPS